MKRSLTFLLVLTLALTLPAAAEEGQGNGFFGGLGSWLDDTLQAAGDAIGDAADAVGSAAGSVSEAIGSAAGSVGDAVGSAAGSVGNAVGNAIDSVSTFAVDTWNAADKAVNGMWTSVTGTQLFDADDQVYMLTVDEDEPITFMGAPVNAGKDTGYSKAGAIEQGDPHYGWTLGQFYIEGATKMIVDQPNGSVIFLKTVGDQLELHFGLTQNINRLNDRDDLAVCSDRDGFDKYFQVEKTDMGRGALITRFTNHQRLAGEPVLYTDYLSAVAAGSADTVIQLNEEGDYEVALDYELQDAGKFSIPQYHDYHIFFTFSVRNGNCMVYLFDASTKAELRNETIIENGFSIDFARSRYLEIHVKRETLAEDGKTLDVRYNKVAQDGDEYTDEGVYTITAKNIYTNEETSKRLFVGDEEAYARYIDGGITVEG